MLSPQDFVCQVQVRSRWSFHRMICIMLQVLLEIENSANYETTVIHVIDRTSLKLWPSSASQLVILMMTQLFGSDLHNDIQ